MNDQNLEQENILFKVEDSSGNQISFHLDRIPSYAHRYISYIMFNDVKIQLTRYNTHREAVMYANWIKKIYKGN